MEISPHSLLPEPLLLGIPQIDAQHENIFHQIETLKLDCLESNTLSKKLIEDLLHYLHEHFSTEEAIALAQQVEFSAHAETHRQTLTTLRRWSKLVLSERRDVFSFLRYLTIWFERHIHEEDQPFAARLLATAANPDSMA